EVLALVDDRRALQDLELGRLGPGVAHVEGHLARLGLDGGRVASSVGDPHVDGARRSTRLRTAGSEQDEGTGDQEVLHEAAPTVSDGRDGTEERPDDAMNTKTVGTR